MGLAKLSLTRVPFKNLSKGYFPNKDFDDVPEGGSNNCKHVIWHRSSLRPFFGMNLVNSVQAATTSGSGLHQIDTNTLSDTVTVFGTKIYHDVSGTMTDITGVVTITAGSLWQFVDHQQGANEFVIGCNGTDAVLKWTGVGDAAVLGGTPPVFSGIEKYHDTLFGANGQFLYFSDFADPETWDTTKWVITFDKDIIRPIKLGTKLAILMGDHIGSVSGYTYLDFQREESEIDTFGCVGRLAVCSAKFGSNETDILAVLAKDGLHFVDSTFGHQHIFGKDWIQEFSQANLSKATLAYDNTEKLLYCALPYETSSENNYLIVVDMLSGAVWPGPDVHTNYIKAMASCEDADENQSIYFVDNNGYMFKFNRDALNYHTGTAAEAIDCYWESGTKDLQDVYEVRNFSCLAGIEGDYSVTIGLQFRINRDDAIVGSVSLACGDVLDSTFILDASTLGGAYYVFDVVEYIGGFGRFLAFYLEKNTLDETFRVKQFECLLKRRRMSYADK